MTTSTLDLTVHDTAPATVQAHELSDGVFVQLAGDLDDRTLPTLRRALLAVRPATCRDVVVDAGAVTAITDDALAVLLAGAAWARDTGLRFTVCRVAPALEAELRALQLDDALGTLVAC